MAQNDNKVIGNDLGLKSVLITRFSAMGNVVMTIPVIYSACLCYPSINFVLATKPSLTELFINKPKNLTVIGIDINDEYSGIGGANRLVNEMKQKYNIDAFIDLQHDSSTRAIDLLCWLKGIKTVKFNRAMHNKHELTRKNNKVMLPLISSRARYRETFFKAGLPIEELFESIYGPGAKAEPEIFANIISTPKAEGEKWIGIAPFAAHPEKEYPLEQMEEVIRMLLKDNKVRIFIFGGAGRETEEAQRWAAMFENTISLAGNRYGFPAELALLSNLDAMLTMDSANMHLASIVGIPTVSIWGATHHYGGFKGWRQSENDMVQAPLSCRPCSIKGDKPCFRHDMLCLTAIRPETIYNKLTEKLNG